METALSASVSAIKTVRVPTTASTRLLNSTTLNPSWPISRSTKLRFCSCNSFLTPKPNPRSRRDGALLLTQCSTASNTDKENSNSAVEPNSDSEIQEPSTTTSNQPFPSSNSSFSRGLVFDLGPENSWDSVEIGSPVVKRFLSDDEERWYMWYYGRSNGDHSLDSIGLAVSSNGVHWERGVGPVSSAGDVGLVLDCSKDWWAFDTNSIRPSEVLIMSSSKVRENNAVYWLYYAGIGTEKVEFLDNSLRLCFENSERVGVINNENDGNREKCMIFKSLPGLAMSQDGRHWARIEGEHHSGALFDVGDDGEWDSMFIASPQVVFHGSGDLRMYYHSFDKEKGEFAVGIARSRDGMRWVKLGKIMGGGGTGSFDECGILNAHVVRNRTDKKYLMVYEGVAADGGRSIGLAVSSDGLKDWKRVQDIPLLMPSEADDWDNERVGSPSLVQMDCDSDEWRLYYRGIGKKGEIGIGLAVSEGNNSKSFTRWTGFQL